MTAHAYTQQDETIRVIARRADAGYARKIKYAEALILEVKAEIVDDFGSLDAVKPYSSDAQIYRGCRELDKIYSQLKDLEYKTNQLLDTFELDDTD